MTPVMYHYVRPDAGALRDYPYLALDDFERQLDYFDSHFGFVGREAFEQWVAGGDVPGGVLLTFDDGLRDHVEFVLPALRRRGVFGLFYVGSAPLTDGVVLEVHKLQLALGRLGGATAFARVEARYPQLLEGSAKDDLGHYAGQNSDLPTKHLKQLLNWRLDLATRREVVDDLFTLAFAGDDVPRAEDVYVDEVGIKQLLDDGMGVGAHGHEHLRLAGLTPDRQRLEIEQRVAWSRRWPEPSSGATATLTAWRAHSTRRPNDSWRPPGVPSPSPWPPRPSKRRLPRRPGFPFHGRTATPFRAVVRRRLAD